MRSARRFLTVPELREQYRFPSERAVRQFLVYHRADITVHKRGRVILVDEAEFDTFMTRKRRLEVKRRAAKLAGQLRYPKNAFGEIGDVHAAESSESVGLAHLNKVETGVR